MTKELRPTHYIEGEDTFAWAEKKFNLEQLEAIALFNIHKYSNRQKGENIKDYGKIADYSLWFAGILEQEDPTKTFLS